MHILYSTACPQQCYKTVSYNRKLSIDRESDLLTNIPSASYWPIVWRFLAVGQSRRCEAASTPGWCCPVTRQPRAGRSVCQCLTSSRRSWRPVARRRQSAGGLQADVDCASSRDRRAACRSRLQWLRAPSPRTRSCPSGRWWRRSWRHAADHSWLSRCHCAQRRRADHTLTAPRHPRAFLQQHPSTIISTR